MAEFADYARQARDALLKGDHEAFAGLIDKNFNLRRNLYGDNAIGKENLEMIKIASLNGFPAKFCGSGGAVVGVCRSDEKFEILQKRYRDKGFSCFRAIIDS